MIEQSVIDSIKDAADVYDVLSDFLHDLRKKGSTYECCCPFHGEKTPSFKVNPSCNSWHCFGCGKGGDAIAFLMEHQHMSYSEALEWLANKYHIQVKYVRKEQTQDEIDTAKHKESMLIALNQVQAFYVQQFNADNDEARKARHYAYSRWGEEYCKEVGIGYAPISSQPLLEYIKRNCLSLDILKELGVISTGEKGDYAFMRERITIPVCNEWGKIVAWTARYLGDRPDVGKYMNPTTSLVFNKSECWFGLDVAKRQARQSQQFIIVEGAPDVMRLQIVGLNEAVAPLGTAMTEQHLLKLRRYCKTVRFIPDSDPPKYGALWGAGVAAVMKNGTMATNLGFTVYVREIPRSKADDEKQVKNDPDSFIINREAYMSLEDKPFIIWYAEKRFAAASDTEAQFAALREIAAMLLFVDDEMMREMFIDRLCSIYGKQKTWKDAIKIAAMKLREREDEMESDGNTSPKERELLRKFDLRIKNQMYYIMDFKKGDWVRLSNFYMIPEFHIKDGKSLRKFTIVNEYGQRETLEVEQRIFSSVQSFQVAAEKKGNYVWLAKQEQLNALKEYLYAITESVEAITVYGWQEKAGFYAFSDGIHNGEKFLPIDSKGMVSFGDNKYYLAPYCDTYADNPNAYDFEKKLCYSGGNDDTLYDFVERLVTVFGDGAKVGFAWVLACIFRDHIYALKDWFPILNLFGIRGSGKTALASALNSFFYVLKQDPPKLGNTSIPALNYMLSHVSDAMVVLDEYTNLLNDKVVDFLKGIWGGTTNTKMNIKDEEGGISTGKVYSGVILCGQHQPNSDTALFTRCVHLTYFRTTFSEAENLAFTKLKEVAKMGNAHLTMQIMSHRDYFVTHYAATYALTRSEMKSRLGEEKVDDRVFDNWICVLSAFRTLETLISVPFTYPELFEICLKGILLQSREVNKTSETHDLWKLINTMHMTGKIFDGTHYRIKAEKSFRSEGSEDVRSFGKPRKLLFLNWSAVQDTIRTRSGLNQMKMDMGALDSYLRTLPYFLGVKQRWFVNIDQYGQPMVEMVGMVAKKKSTRARALVFDYEELTNAAEIDLESVVVNENEVDNEDEDTPNIIEEQAQQVVQSQPQQPTLFNTPTEEEELPF